MQIEREYFNAIIKLHMTTLQNIPYMVRAVPETMITILFILSPWIFYISTALLLILGTKGLIIGKQSEGEKREIYKCAIIVLVSGIMYYTAYLYLENTRYPIFPKNNVKDVSIPSGLKIDFLKPSLPPLPVITGMRGSTLGN